MLLIYTYGHLSTFSSSPPIALVRKNILWILMQKIFLK